MTSRTRELAETIKITIVEASILGNNSSLPELIKSINFDGKAYDRRRSELASRYVSLFADVNVPITPDLVALASPTEMRS